MRTLAALVATLALHCAPVVVGTKNYGTTPEQQMQTAVQNMRAIAADACAKRSINVYPYCENLSFDADALHYVERTCLSRQYQVHGNVGAMACIADTNITHSIAWDDMLKAYGGGNTVKVCSDKKCVTIHGFRSSEQAQGFAKAIDMYVADKIIE